ncbi:hypothetical protein [Oceanobacillus indicireducens]|uniref:Uncharacterized protein n=1 Tax=Oceanobacillus indicireducens TaxID=1004261 RepID=A0A917XV71_9BACI|nr:hypothetical protein [Oceanobacillus indicireducens]GGN55052.1 hypothetical protein GCM10007971_13460 [Oceanobacillus indicireducens]
MQFLNAVIQFLIIFGTALLGLFLGEGNTYLVIMISVIILEAVIIAYLINKITKIKEEMLSTRETFTSEILSKKLKGENTVDITVFPKKSTEFSTNKYTELTLVINTPIEVGNNFDIQIQSDKEINLKVAEFNEIKGILHAGKYLYFIKNNYIHKKMGKYLKCHLAIKLISEHNSINLEITASDQELHGSKSFIINIK